jgi:hypothetical protein
MIISDILEFALPNGSMLYGNADGWLGGKEAEQHVKSCHPKRWKKLPEQRHVALIPDGKPYFCISIPHQLIGITEIRFCDDGGIITYQRPNDDTHYSSSEFFDYVAYCQLIGTDYWDGEEYESDSEDEETDVEDAEAEDAEIEDAEVEGAANPDCDMKNTLTAAMEKDSPSQPLGLAQQRIAELEEKVQQSQKEHAEGEKKLSNAAVAMSNLFKNVHELQAERNELVTEVQKLEQAIISKDNDSQSLSNQVQEQKSRIRTLEDTTRGQLEQYHGLYDEHQRLTANCTSTIRNLQALINERDTLSNDLANTASSMRISLANASRLEELFSRASADLTAKNSELEKANVKIADLRVKEASLAKLKADSLSTTASEEVKFSTALSNQKKELDHFKKLYQEALDREEKVEIELKNEKEVTTTLRKDIAQSAIEAKKLQSAVAQADRDVNDCAELTAKYAWLCKKDRHNKRITSATAQTLSRKNRGLRTVAASDVAVKNQALKEKDLALKQCEHYLQHSQETAIRAGVDLAIKNKQLEDQKIEHSRRKEENISLLQEISKLKADAEDSRLLHESVDMRLETQQTVIDVLVSLEPRDELACSEQKISIEKERYRNYDKSKQILKLKKQLKESDDKPLVEKSPADATSSPQLLSVPEITGKTVKKLPKTPEARPTLPWEAEVVSSPGVKKLRTRFHPSPEEMARILAPLRATEPGNKRRTESCSPKEGSTSISKTSEPSITSTSSIEPSGNKIVSDLSLSKEVESVPNAGKPPVTLMVEGSGTEKPVELCPPDAEPKSTLEVIEPSVAPTVKGSSIGKSDELCPSEAERTLTLEFMEPYLTPTFAAVPKIAPPGRRKTGLFKSILQNIPCWTLLLSFLFSMMLVSDYSAKNIVPVESALKFAESPQLIVYKDVTAIVTISVIETQTKWT